jgi:hypothetical protein
VIGYFAPFLFTLYIIADLISTSQPLRTHTSANDVSYSFDFPSLLNRFQSVFLGAVRNSVLAWTFRSVTEEPHDDNAMDNIRLRLMGCEDLSQRVRSIVLLGMADHTHFSHQHGCSENLSAINIDVGKPANNSL